MRSGRNSAACVALVGAGALLAGRAMVRARRRMDFRGRIVLITGGSRGLGIILARQFAAEGAKLALCARDANELERAAEELRSGGAEVLTVPCDVGVAAEVTNMIEAVIRHFGRIDVLVNNVGTIGVGPAELMTLSDYEASMQTNFWASVYTTLLVAPSMRDRREGRIVNIASIGGKIAVPHLLPYSTGKFALVGFSEGMRAEMAKSNVLVTTVCPGLIRTGSPRNAAFKGQHKKEYAWFAIGDSTPAVSMSAERAARRIVEAARFGEAEVILSVPAKLATWFHGLFPGATAEVSALINRLLPSPGGIGRKYATGKESESVITRSFATRLSQQAALANNQIAPGDTL